MRIEDVSRINQIYQATSVKKTAQTQKTSFSDQLAISQTGKDMQVAKTAVKAAPDVRQDKIAEIKAKMESGFYDANYEAIVDKMVDGIYANKSI